MQLTKQDSPVHSRNCSTCNLDNNSYPMDKDHGNAVVPPCWMELYLTYQGSLCAWGTTNCNNRSLTRINKIPSTQLLPSNLRICFQTRNWLCWKGRGNSNSICRWCLRRAKPGMEMAQRLLYCHPRMLMIPKSECCSIHLTFDKLYKFLLVAFYWHSVLLMDLDTMGNPIFEYEIKDMQYRKEMIRQ